jgi:FkbM family methyltransferase
MDRDQHFSLPRALGLIRELGWTPGGIVDIGVAAGTPGLYPAWPDAPICLIEPSPDSLLYMRQIAEKYPRVHIFNCGASDRSGELEARQPEGLVNVFFNGRGKGNPRFVSRTLKVRTCDEMVAETDLQPPFLYKLDTDSHEREALAGSSRTIARSDVCVIETNVFHAVRGCMTPMEIWQLMAGHGFTLLDMADYSVGEEGVLRAVDFVFVREDSELFRQAYAHSGKGVRKNRKRAEQYRELARENSAI